VRVWGYAVTVLEETQAELYELGRFATVQICCAGNRTLAQVHDHLAHDGIVAWGWAPGADRAPAPGSQAELAALFHAWIETGAACPAEDKP
jgi:hypothetical protein